MVLYAIWQEVFWAHAFWQGLRAMRKYFMPYGKKYSGGTFWQGLGAMRQYFMPSGKKYSGHMPFRQGLGAMQ